MDCRSVSENRGGATCGSAAPTRRERSGRALRRGASVLVLLALVAAPWPASAREDYDPKRAGNPLKIVYYLAYPVAFTLDWVIFRPAYFIGSYQPFRTIFGREPSALEVELQKQEADQSEPEDS